MLTTIPKLTKKAQDVFNAFIRRRDEDKPCISCGKPGNQAGHYYSVKQFSALRYDEDNVHLQCAYCNKYAHGNIQMYRKGLISRIGEERLLRLDTIAIEERIKKWTRTELEHIIKTYAKK